MTTESLPPHAPRCFGCGPENPCGLRVEAVREDDHVRATVTFGAHHSGAPAFAHGGAVATAMDDALGFLLYVIGEPAVTAKLEVNYRKPVLIEQEYTLLARATGREGRKIFTSVEMCDPAGAIVAEANGLFVTVGIEHFTRDLPDDWRERAAERGIELPW